MPSRPLVPSPSRSSSPPAVQVGELLDALPEAVILTDLDGRIVSWNRGATELYGYRRDDVLGRALAEVVPTISLRGDTADLQLELQRGEMRIGVEMVRRADGRPASIQYRTAPVRDADGHIVAHVGVSRGTTDTVAAEALLRRNAEMHQVLFDASPTAKWIIDRETLRFLEVNEAAVALYGYSRDEFLAMTLDRVHVHDSVPLRGWLADPVGTHTRHESMLHQTRDGRQREVTITRRDIEFAGRRARLATIVDLTEQRAAERELRHREALFRTLTENAFEIMVIFARDGRFTMTSSVRALGYAADRVTGRHYSEFVHPDDLAAFRDVLAAIVDTPGARRRMELRTRDASGAWRVLEGEVLNLLTHPTIAGFVAHCRDVTEQRATEAALRETALQLQHAQKMEAIGRLAGGIAHDFNNLLTAIRGYTELARMRLPAEHETDGDLAEVLAATDRAAALTRQLLAYSRRQLLQPKRLALDEVIRSLEAMLRRLLDDDIALEVAVAPGTPNILADESQLHQVIVNLVVNARDALRQGGRVRIDAYPAELAPAFVSRSGCAAAGAYAVIAVSDTGSGMPPEVRERIFEPFFTTKGPGEGTGLGLSTVYGIVQQSGGFIDVESGVGQGSCFQVFLPAAAEDAAPPGSQPPETPSEARGCESVLVVEPIVAAYDLSELGAEIVQKPFATRTLLSRVRETLDAHQHTRRPQESPA